MVLSKAAIFQRIGSAFISITKPQAWWLKWTLYTALLLSHDSHEFFMGCYFLLLIWPAEKEIDFLFFLYTTVFISLIKTFTRSKAKG